MDTVFREVKIEAFPYLAPLTGKIPGTNPIRLQTNTFGYPTGMQRISIPPGHLVTPHFHPDSNETTLCLQGRGKVGLLLPDKNSIGGHFEERCFQTDDVVFLPQGFPHYFINTGEEALVLLATFDNFQFNTINFTDLLAQFPKQVLSAVHSNANNKSIIAY